MAPTSAASAAGPAPGPVPGPAATKAMPSAAVSGPIGGEAPTATVAIDPNQLAEPISPLIAQRFPHLQRYVGHVVLGGPSLQVVLQGIPLEQGSGAPQPFVLAVFALEGGTWKTRSALRGLTLSWPTASGKLEPRVRGLELLPKRGVAQAALLVELPPAGGVGATGRLAQRPIPAARADDDDDEPASSPSPASVSGDGGSSTGGSSLPNGRAPSVRVQLTLDASRGRLAVALLPGSDGDASAIAPLLKNWRLGLTGHGRAVAVPGGRGSRYVLCADGPDVAALLSPGGVAFAAAGGGQGPVCEGEVNTAGEPIEILFGPAAAATIMGREATLAVCPALALTGSEPGPGACAPRVELGTLGIGVAAPVEGDRDSGDLGAMAELEEQGVWIFDQQARPVAYTVARPQSSIVVTLPAPGLYQLGSTLYGRTFPGIGVVSVAPRKATMATLPPRGVGFVRVTMPPAAAWGAAGEISEARAEAALLFIQRLDGPTGTPAPSPTRILATVADGETDGPVAWSKSPRSWLVRRWPVDVELPAGSYGLVVLAGKTGYRCVGRVAVRTRHRAALDCAAIGDGERMPPSAMGALAPAWQQAVFADLAGSIGSGPSLAEQAAALGAEIFVADLGRAISDRPTASEDAAKASGDGDGPLPGRGLVLDGLTVRDASLATTLRFLPATPTLATRWAQAEKAPKIAARRIGADIFGRFAQFLHDEGAKGWLELGCPGPGMGPSEYESLARRIGPDALRLVGCTGHWPADAVRRLGATVLPGHVTPPQVTVASWFDDHNGGEAWGINLLDHYLPRMAFTELPAMTPKTVLKALRDGRWCASLGGVLAFKGISRNAGDAGLTATFDYAVAPGVVATELVVTSERGVLGRIPLAVDGRNQSGSAIKVPLSHGSGAQLMRGELRGTAPALVVRRGGKSVREADPEVGLLATTNFQPLPAGREAKR